jgi:hypothetical protein
MFRKHNLKCYRSQSAKYFCKMTLTSTYGTFLHQCSNRSKHGKCFPSVPRRCDWLFLGVILRWLLLTSHVVLAHRECNTCLAIGHPTRCFPAFLLHRSPHNSSATIAIAMVEFLGLQIREDEEPLGMEPGSPSLVLTGLGKRGLWQARPNRRDLICHGKFFLVIFFIY